MHRTPAVCQAYALALSPDYWPYRVRHYHWPHFGSVQTETQSGEVTSAGGPAGKGVGQNPRLQSPHALLPSALCPALTL